MGYGLVSLPGYCYSMVNNQHQLVNNQSAKIALILTQTLILTLIPTLTLTQTEEKHYFASRGKIATS